MPLDAPVTMATGVLLLLALIRFFPFLDENNVSIEAATRNSGGPPQFQSGLVNAEALFHRIALIPNVNVVTGKFAGPFRRQLVNELDLYPVDIVDVDCTNINSFSN